MSDFNENGIFGGEAPDNEKVNETEKVVEEGVNVTQPEQNNTPEGNVKPNVSEETLNDFSGYMNTPNASQQPQRPQYPYNNTQGQTPYNYSRQNYYNGADRQNGNPPQFNGNYPYGGSDNRPNPYSYTYNQPDKGYAYPQNPAPAPKKKKNGGKIFIVVAAVLFIFIIIGIIASLFGGKGEKEVNEGGEEETSASLNVEEFTSNKTPASDTHVSEQGALAPKEIYEKVKESSVGVLVYDSSKSLSSEGTGVIMTEDKDGKYTYIITCAHVISDKNVSIMVQLFSGKDYAAQVVGFDAKTDIGVLRIEESGLRAAEYGDSSKLNVGDTVYAIGNPGGTEFANSFTNGMISAIDRPVSSSSTGYTMECIQHTAAINPGNSGGALVNEFGQVIGINSMKIIADEYEGMGFAVPSSVFIDIVNEIITNGYVSNRPKIGITYVAASTQQSYAMYVAIKGLPSGSIIVYSISEDSDLANTDVQKGDLIVAVNGKGLDDASDLSEVIEHSKVGDTIKLSIVRINNDYTAKEFDVDVKLVEDRGDTMPEEETTTSPYEGFFNEGGNGYGGYGSDSYEDFFNDFFGRYFNP